MPRHLTVLIIAALVPITALAAEEPQGTARFVPKEHRAPVAYETVNGLIYFTANVAGREVSAMLDTGATSSLLDIEFARGAGLAIAAAEKPLKTQRGQIPMQRLSSEVTILIPGQIEAHHSSIAAVDMKAASIAAGRKIEFVLGQDLLRPLALLVDPARKVFQVAPSGVFKPPPGTIEVNVLADKLSRVEITIGNEKVQVIIDTGSMGKLALTPEAWARVVPKDAARGTTISSGGEGKAHASRSALLPQVQIGALTLTEVVVSEGPSRSDGDGLLGMGILGDFRWVLDIKMGKLWLGAVPPAK